MKGKRELPNEVGEAVRDYRVMHEENFWSSWIREDEREREVKKKERQEPRRMKRKSVRRGKERRRKKRTKRRRSEEDVRVLFLLRLLKFLVKGETWRVVVIFLGRILGGNW